MSCLLMERVKKKLENSINFIYLFPNLHEEVPEVKFLAPYFLVAGLPVVMTFNYSPVVFKQLFLLISVKNWPQTTSFQGINLR